MNKLFFPKNTSVELTATNSINLRLKLVETGKYKVKGLGISCTLKDWDQQEQRVRRSNGQFAKHNKQLKFIEDEVQAIELNRKITANDIDQIVKASIKEISVEKLKNSEKLLLNMVKSYYTFIEPKSNYSPHTKRRVKSVERTLIDFQKSVKYEISADTLNESSIRIQKEIISYFKKRGTKDSTARAFLGNLNVAIGHYNNHSGKEVKTFNRSIEKWEKDEKQIVALTKDELKKLYDFVFKPNPKRVLKPKPIELRNLKFFLFRCFCGMRVGDMTSDNINPETLTKDSKTFTYYQDKGTKTATVSCIGSYLYDIASSLNWEFPNKERIKSLASYSYGETTHVRKYLGRLLASDMRKIQHITDEHGRTFVNLVDEVTTHTPRKTYAHLLYGITKDIMRVKKELGHTKIETTMRYLDFILDDEASSLKQIDVFNQEKA